MTENARSKIDYVADRACRVAKTEDQCERIAMETKELTAARLARFSANHSKRD